MAKTLALTTLILALLASSAQGAISTSAPCSSATNTSYKHVVLVMMENHSYSSIAGHSPYLNGLAKACGLTTNYQNVAHPSLPNYMALTSGKTFFSSDCAPSSCSTSAQSIFGELGTNWKIYAESMVSYCQTKDSSPFVVHHDPAPYYTAIRSACKTQDVPLGSTTNGLQHDLSAGTLPAFSMVVPNVNDDEHNGTISQGDSWLKKWLPKVFAGANYQAGNTLVEVTYDETGGGSGGIYTVVAAPSVHPGTTSSSLFNHYSLLRTNLLLLGKSCLGRSCDSADMRSAFHL